MTRRLIPSEERSDNEKVSDNEQTDKSAGKNIMASRTEVSQCQHFHQALVLSHKSTRFP